VKPASSQNSVWVLFRDSLGKAACWRNFPRSLASYVTKKNFAGDWLWKIAWFLGIEIGHAMLTSPHSPEAAVFGSDSLWHFRSFFFFILEALPEVALLKDAIKCARSGRGGCYGDFGVRVFGQA